MQTRLVRLIIRLEERKVDGRLEEILSHCLQPSHLMFNMSPCCECAIGIRRVLVLFYNTKQAMGKRKSCSVETRLNGLVATALYGLESHLRQ